MRRRLHVQAGKVMDHRRVPHCVDGLEDLMRQQQGARRALDLLRLNSDSPKK